MRHREVVMGVPMSVDIRDDQPDDVIRDAVVAAFAVLHDADRRFSPFLADSEVRRHERGEADPSADLTDILAVADWAHTVSDGAFDIRTPDGRLDTNGVVKGWAAQRAADALVHHGLRSFCLNAGGDVAVRGAPGAGRGWRVGVRDPDDPARMLAVLDLWDGAVATSGTYERGAHVWDGRTGTPASGLVGATVVAPSLLVADVLATAVLALGPDGVAWAPRHGASWVMGVATDRTITTAGTITATRSKDPGKAP